MKLTKYEHSAVLLEKDGEALLIDPGNFARPFGKIPGLVAVVVTHEHLDHIDPKQLERILAENPGVQLISGSGVAASLPKYDWDVVSPGDTREAGSFHLDFYGGKHAIIHESIPQIENVGVGVDGKFWYSGDSFSVPPVANPQWLAVPASAPWLKVGEVMDYVLEVKPRNAIYIHEIILSEAGMGMMLSRIQKTTEHGGGVFHPLGHGESVEI